MEIPEQAPPIKDTAYQEKKGKPHPMFRHLTSTSPLRAISNCSQVDQWGKNRTNSSVKSVKVSNKDMAELLDL